MTHAVNVRPCLLTSVRKTLIAQHDTDELQRALSAYIKNRIAWGNSNHIAYQGAESALWTFVIGEEGSAYTPPETAFSIAPYLHPLGRSVGGMINMTNLGAKLTKGIQELLDRADIKTCNLQEEINKIRPLAKTLIDAAQAHPDRTKIRTRIDSQPFVYTAQPPSSRCAIL